MSQNLSDKEFARAAVALRRAIREVGGVAEVARNLGLSTSSVSAWTICPHTHVTRVCELSGVGRADLRPDLYGGGA